MGEECLENWNEMFHPNFHPNWRVIFFRKSSERFWNRGERERIFGSREREGKLKIPFPFYGKGTGIRKCYGKGREWDI